MTARKDVQSILPLPAPLAGAYIPPKAFLPMYLSRPPISPTPADKQLAKKPSVALHRGPGNVTTAMVLDPDQVRHPVSGRFTSRWQNEQSSQGPSEETRLSQDRSNLKPNTY